MKTKRPVRVYLKDGKDTVYLKTTEDMLAAFKLIQDQSELLGGGLTFLISEMGGKDL